MSSAAATARVYRRGLAAARALPALSGNSNLEIDGSRDKLFCLWEKLFPLANSLTTRRFTSSPSFSGKRPLPRS